MLVVNRKLRIANDVDEQDMGDLQLDFFFNFGRHYFARILNKSVSYIKRGAQRAAGRGQKSEVSKSYVIPSKRGGSRKCGIRHPSRRDPSLALRMTKRIICRQHRTPRFRPTPNNGTSVLRRERRDDFFKARIAAQRIPKGKQT